MINCLSSDTKVYVIAPARISTGGPELLHQLVYHLRNSFNLDAYMFYVPINIANPVHPDFYEYNNPYVREIEDKKSNILIVPEVISCLKYLNKYKNIRKIIWWLSVDNFYLTMILDSRFKFFIKRIINKFSRICFNKNIFDIHKLIFKNVNLLRLDNYKFINKSEFHFVQSYYAFSHLISKGICRDKIYYLSDYLNKNFLEIKTNFISKKDLVCYNPKKGYEITKKIIEKGNGIQFDPIINLSRHQVIEKLQKAKVYIDFGYHPGKDRIPREAAILGCCVITSKKGSAAYYEDVPIPDEYKFEDIEENIPQILAKIKDCFENYEERLKDFNFYRQVIKQEPQKFIEDLKNIFAKGNI